MSNPASSAPLVAIRSKVLQPLFEELSIKAESVRALDDPPSASGIKRNALLGVAAGVEPATEAREILRIGEQHVSDEGLLLVLCIGPRDEAQLARLRNALWPTWHVTSLYELAQMKIVRVTHAGRAPVRGGVSTAGTLVVARRRAFVMAPAATVEKFDKNAASWNGDARSPHWKHHRWMRRFVGTYADASRARRILDFGCGAGWCGIEAALAARAAGAKPSLAFFDPSPEMVRYAAENARAAGLDAIEGRTGFGEAPPFPAQGEERFDLVISSGVVSFSPDFEQFCDGLLSTLAPGATLVIGDIQRESKGMLRRRANRALLPVREMNARTPPEMRAALERRGLKYEEGSGYQRSDPVPQLLHLDQARLHGALGGLLLAWNRRAADADRRAGGRRPHEFDSWVQRYTVPAKG